MPSSTDSNRRTESKEDKKARFAMLRAGTPPKEREEVSDLPRWVKTALVFKELDGQSYNDAAEKMGKTGQTLSQYARSPAGKLWREEVRKFADDPVQVAKAILRSHVVGITLERLAFLEMAIRAGDYTEGDKIARDLQDRAGITKAAAPTSGSAIVINLPAGTSIAPSELAEEAEWKIVEEDD